MVLEKGVVVAQVVEQSPCSLDGLKSLLILLFTKKTWNVLKEMNSIKVFSCGSVLNKMKWPSIFGSDSRECLISGPWNKVQLDFFASFWLNIDKKALKPLSKKSRLFLKRDKHQIVFSKKNLSIKVGSDFKCVFGFARWLSLLMVLWTALLYKQVA